MCFLLNMGIFHCYVSLPEGKMNALEHLSTFDMIWHCFEFRRQDARSYPFSREWKTYKSPSSPREELV